MTDFHDSCADIMVTDPPTLHPSMTLNDACDVIHKLGVRYLSVVDDDGNFVGIFSSMTLVKLLLPDSVSFSLGKNPFDLSFMTTTIEELRERLAERGQEKITDYVITDNFTPCTPKTTIMEALHILYKNHCHVVITEENSSRFLGVVTINSILTHVKATGEAL